MKRDMSLIRELLLELESMPGNEVFSFTQHREAWGGRNADAEVSVEGYTPAQIAYHLSLLKEIGFIESPEGSPPPIGIMFGGLTWAGHAYLDAVRNPDIWRKTKEGAEAAGGFTVDILRDLAKGFIKTLLSG